MTVVPAPPMLAAAVVRAGSAAQRQCAAHVRKASTDSPFYPAGQGAGHPRRGCARHRQPRGRDHPAPDLPGGPLLGDNKWAITAVFFAQTSIGCGRWHGWCARRWGCEGTLTLYRPDLNRAATSSCRRRPSCWVGCRSPRLSGLGAGAAADHPWGHAACF